MFFTKKTVSLFIVVFIASFLLMTGFSWVNYFNFKNNTQDNEMALSMLIANDVKTRYEATNGFIKAMDPFITETMKKTLNSMEIAIKDDKQVSDASLKELRDQYNVTNIYIINEDGTVKYSTNPKEVGSNTKDLYKDRTDMNWETIFNNVLKNKDIYIDKFSKSEFHPYRFTKWGYKGIGYVDGLGIVVLEIGIEVGDIKEENVANLVSAVKNLDRQNPNVVSVELINSAPSDQNTVFKEGQYRVGNQIYTKINMTNLSGQTSQAVVVTQFDEIDGTIKTEFYDAIIWTVFTSLFALFISILFYNRFNMPTNFDRHKESIERSIEELKNL
jgi:hypothetical protein